MGEGVVEGIEGSLGGDGEGECLVGRGLPDFDAGAVVEGAPVERDFDVAADPAGEFTAGVADRCSAHCRLLCAIRGAGNARPATGPVARMTASAITWRVVVLGDGFVFISSPSVSEPLLGPCYRLKTPRRGRLFPLSLTLRAAWAGLRVATAPRGSWSVDACGRASLAIALSGNKRRTHGVLGSEQCHP